MPAVLWRRILDLMSAPTFRAPQPLSVTSPSPAAPDVSVVIVNYNVREFLEQALTSVERASSGLNVEVFVVDNNSVDGSVKMVRDRFPDVQLIANEHNAGFARANNQAIREAQGRHILILNPDTLLQEDTLRKLVSFMDANEDAGAVGCRILNPDGTFAPESRRAFPTPSVALYRMVGLSRLFPRSRVFARYNLGYIPADQQCEVDALSGSCMMVRREALLRSRESAFDYQGDVAPLEPGDFVVEDGAGLFDEEFFMYGEDLDWCFRIQQAGWRIFYTPETQIIHYKGESTRKGELRYVRLFYGAMLRFTDKHFAGKHSRFVAGLIRAGILVRGMMSAGAKLVGQLSVPMLDFALALFAAIGAGFAWSMQVNVDLPGVYLAAVAPVTALAITLTIAVAGGYRRRGHRSPFPLRPALSGMLVAFLVMATALYFVPDFAFSRAALVLSFVGTAVLLIGWRLVVNRRRYGHRRGLLVGGGKEATRLSRALGQRIDPPLQLVGFVSDAERPSSRSVEHLGASRHLRDLVRLRHIDDVIFASDSLTNTQILGMMRSLRDLPVQFKILTAGQDRIIGKASVDDLSTPLREAEQVVAPVRSPIAARALEVLLAAIGMAAHPFIKLMVRVQPANARMRRIAGVTTRLPSVLAGRRALIGFDATAPHPPAAWGLRPGVVSILDSMPRRPSGIVATHRAYWFYARNQSAALDIEILLRSLFRAT